MHLPTRQDQVIFVSYMFVVVLVVFFWNFMPGQYASLQPMYIAQGHIYFLSAKLCTVWEVCQIFGASLSWKIEWLFASLAFAWLIVGFPCLIEHNAPFMHIGFQPAALAKIVGAVLAVVLISFLCVDGPGTGSVS